MHLSPAQTYLAANAAQRIRLIRANQLRHGGEIPDGVEIPFEELECLARAAAPALGMDPDAFDLGGFNPLPEIPAGFGATLSAMLTEEGAA